MGDLCGCVALTEVSQQKLRRLFSGSQQIKLSRYGQSITEWMLILPFAYHVYQFDACQQRLRSSERVESQHRTCPSFDITVILFHKVIQVLTLPDSDAFFFRFVGIEHGQRRRIGATFIDSHHFGFTVVANGLAKETQGSSGIPFGGQQEIDGLTCSINGTVQVFPVTFDFYVGFVHAPPTSHGVFMPAKGFIQQRHQADNPAVKRGMSNDNAALGHHLFEITQTQGIGQVPAHTQGNDIDGIMQAFEGISDQRHGQATS
nr:hypothetical protein 348p1_00075 [Serratia grimesii]